MTHPIIDKIVEISPHLKWMEDRTALLVRHGSHAYGTNTPSSDEDFKGICIPPKEYFNGFVKNFEQAELYKPDAVVFEITKFFKLASDCNPNAIEMLFVDQEDIVYTNLLGEELIKNRDLFLSKKVKHTMTGYAVSQLKRIKLHKKYLLNPPSKLPTRKDLGLPEQTLIPQDQLMAATAEVQKELDRFQFDFMDDLPESTKIGIRSIMTEMLAELKVTTEDHWMAAARKIGLSDNFIQIMQRERAYVSAKREWDQYQNWKKNRNQARAALEEKFGYDCYLDDTEFLTATGWKKYEDISDNEKLATLNQKTNQIEYQLPYERISKDYSGPIVFLKTQHTNCAVTPNHRMWVSDINRKKENNFSIMYNNESSNWHIEKAENLINDHKSWFHIRNTADPNHIDYDISDMDLKLIGAYISEGCIDKRSNSGRASAIRLSQKNDGKMCALLEEISNYFNMNRYEYIHKKKDGTECVEYVYTLASVITATNLEKFGTSSNNKRLPEWSNQLSQRQVKILLNSLLLGNGSFRKNSSVYHTSSKQLSNDIQTLCISNGIISDIWGPYKNRDDSPMYRVYIGQERAAAVARFNITSNHCKIEKVVDRKIVCFSVPNEILITRRNGKIAIQGNTKHAYHLVRLIRMCKEILTTGKVIVKRPDREELLTIRNGAWSYDQLIEFADHEEKELNVLYNTSTILPKIPNKEKLDQLCVQLIDKSLSKYSYYNLRKHLKL